MESMTGPKKTSISLGIINAGTSRRQSVLQFSLRPPGATIEEELPEDVDDDEEEVEDVDGVEAALALVARISNR